MKNEYMVTWTEEHTERVMAENEQSARNRFEEIQRWRNNLKNVKEVKVEEVPYMDDDAARWDAKDRYEEWLCEKPDKC